MENFQPPDIGKTESTDNHDHSNKFGAVDKLVGKMSDDIRRDIVGEFKSLYEDQSPHKAELKDKEREKREEEEEIINLANQLTNELLQRYGLKPLDVYLENVHIIKKDKWWRNSQVGGYYKMYDQAVFMVEQPANIVLFEKMIHELIHLKSYNAIQVVQGTEKSIGDYRMGMEVTSRDARRWYFKLLNEAVTEKLTMAIFSQSMNNLLFADDLAKTVLNKENYKKKIAEETGKEFIFNDNVYYVGQERNTWPQQVGRKIGLVKGKQEVIFDSHGYSRERELLDILIDRIMQHHHEYSDKSEVFDIFVKAVLQGDIRPLARVIESTFGKGTFRRFGEFDDIEKLKYFVKKL